FDEQHVRLELPGHFRETVIRYQKERGLIEDAGLARCVDDASDVGVHPLRYGDRGRRARAVLMMGIVERDHMYQHQVRLVGVDDVFADRAPPPIGGVVATSAIRERLRQQAWSRILSSSFAGRGILLW